jgi:PAS domain S-box-containing protein
LAELQARLLNAQEQLRKEHAELRSAQVQLNISRRRYADLFEFAPVGYVTLDREGFIREINSVAASLLSASVSAIRGSSFAAYVTPEEIAGFREYLRSCWTAVDRVDMEIALRRRNGSFFPAQLTTTPAHEDGHGHVELRMTIVDLTELKRTQHAIERAKEDLERRVAERTAELSRANQELSEEVARRSRLEVELLGISEREKRRFGQDLHDETCQSLAGLSLLGGVIAKELRDSPPSIREKVERLSDELRALVEQTRSIARGLHPVTLTGGLALALRELADHVQKRVPCTLQIVEEISLSQEQELELYRIAQEASHNAVRHANASRIQITLRRMNSQLQLLIEDDGIGLPTVRESAPSTGMGLDIMGYRAHAIGAVLVVERKAEGGVAVICSLPLKVKQKRGRRESGDGAVR